MGGTVADHGRSTRAGYSLLVPTLVIMGLALAAPLILMAVTSLKSQSGISFSQGWTLAQYGDVLGRASYGRLFLRSVLISGAVTLATVALAYPIAHFVAFHARRKFIWLVALTIPFWTSYLLRVFAWKIILGFNGVINSGLMRLHLIGQPLEFLLYNPSAVVVALAHAWAAFAILPIYVSLEKIDRSLLEAASDLGDSALRRFLRVTLPLSMPGVIGAAILIFVPTTGDFVTPELVGGPTGTMIANVIEVQFNGVGNWPLGAALSMVSMAMVGVIAGLFVASARAAMKAAR
jgi:spermidine/putrescine transport system permease protein